jgi:peptide deformylase
MGKTLDDLLLLGDPRLYQVCDEVFESELDQVAAWVQDLREVMEAVRTRYKFGRAIAAPQLGIMKRLIYMEIGKPLVLINPFLSQASEEVFELWDDCMSFPNLLVRVSRHSQIRVRYRDERWDPVERIMKMDLSELIQHECDHLDGILCTMRALDDKSFQWISR